jgi:four helix bundle protein
MVCSLCIFLPFCRGFSIEFWIGEPVSAISHLRILSMERFKSLKAYEYAFEQANEVFEWSKTLPRMEEHGLTIQIRRSSRSVCSNIAEGYRKRLYRAHFITKLTDADAENSETSVWLDLARSSGYLDAEEYSRFMNRNREVGRLLGYMIRNPDKFRI